MESALGGGKSPQQNWAMEDLTAKNKTMIPPGEQFTRRARYSKSKAETVLGSEDWA